MASKHPRIEGRQKTFFYSVEGMAYLIHCDIFFEILANFRTPEDKGTVLGEIMTRCENYKLNEDGKRHEVQILGYSVWYTYLPKAPTFQTKNEDSSSEDLYEDKEFFDDETLSGDEEYPVVHSIAPHATLLVMYHGPGQFTIAKVPSHPEPTDSEITKMKILSIRHNKEGHVNKTYTYSLERDIGIATCTVYGLYS